MINRGVVVKVVFLCTAIFGISNAALIPSSYGTANHSNATWQQLGLSDVLDDGVTWSTTGISGVFGNEVINEGDNVVFKFDMVKDEWGLHDFDALRVWIDFDQDGTFDNKDILNLTDGGIFDYDINGLKNKSFYSDVLTFDDVGDYYLRARVTCSQELSQLDKPYWPYQGWNYYEQSVTTADWAAFTATRNIVRNSYLPGQGDSEDWKFTVVPHNVPEPTLISLLGCGLLGLAFFRRRNSK